MSQTFFACIMISIIYMGLFFLWGRSFLTVIRAERDVASSIVFGYLLLQFIYHIFYFPFFLSKGSFRALSYSWLAVIVVISILLVIYLKKHPNEKKQKHNNREKIAIIIAGIIIFSLSIFISLHLPYYGVDTRTYISSMNHSYYRDGIWTMWGELYLHYGMSSMYQFFTVPSLLTGIKPYYISLFSVRILGISMFSLIVYRTGNIVFRKTENSFSIYAIVLAVLVPLLLMFWGSNYTAEFFYWRIYEAKGYCQFILLPMGFSVFLAMFRDDVARKNLWKEQLLIGLAAVPVSASSLTSYLFLLLMGTGAILVYDKLKHGWRTTGHSFICALPNLIYLFLYFLEKKGTIVL